MFGEEYTYPYHMEDANDDEVLPSEDEDVEDAEDVDDEEEDADDKDEDE